MQDGSLIISTLLSRVVAQVLKIPYTRVRNKHWDWECVLKSGGMPSSHTALVIGLSTSCLKNFGLYSPYFAVCTAISLIVMYDATGVRRQSGEQAVVINEIIETLEGKFSKGLNEAAVAKERPKLKAVLGHKPVEVLGGILVGILTATLVQLA